jgi:ATP-dependent DNA ligase
MPTYSIDTENNLAVHPDKDAWRAVKPMLASLYVPQGAKFPVDVQPKLDGLRCLVSADDLVLRSRGGKSYHLPHIAQQLARILPSGAIADGELYVHGVPLQTLVSLVTRQQLMTSAVELHIFDVLAGDWPVRTWRDRRTGLEAIEAKAAAMGCDAIRFVKTTTAASGQDVDRLHDEFVAAGCEGAILRAPDARYATGARGAALLKYKRFDDAEFEIVGAVSAHGTDAGCVVWQCATESGRIFEVVPAWSDDERRAAFAKAGSFIGRMLTVSFCGRTAAGVPRCATGIAVRAAEDMPSAAGQL